MRKKLVSLAVSAAMLVTSMSVPVFANGDSGAAELSSDASAVIAFEGAEGSGMYTEGARGALNGGEKIEAVSYTHLHCISPYLSIPNKVPARYASPLPTRSTTSIFLYGFSS